MRRVVGVVSTASVLALLVGCSSIARQVDAGSDGGGGAAGSGGRGGSGGDIDGGGGGSPSPIDARDAADAVICCPPGPVICSCYSEGGRARAGSCANNRTCDAVPMEWTIEPDQYGCPTVTPTRGTLYRSCFPELPRDL